MGNATLRVRRPGPRVVAPDDVPVWPVELAPARHMTLAEGLLEPGAVYRPHAHRTIEQLTYVLAGRVRITSFDEDAGQTQSVELGARECVVSLPRETIEFACVGNTAARVLFVTSPPYPADHSDTIVLREHQSLADES
ncbi:MAG: cupin domain-containing protein [Chloroflexi bacterium]|nr:cupin domain-containing protein [Chloroflexota bacterium]